MCSTIMSSVSQLGIFLGLKGQHGKRLCQGGTSLAQVSCTSMCLCGSSLTSGCVINGLGATVAHCVIVTRLCS